MMIFFFGFKFHVTVRAPAGVATTTIHLNSVLGLLGPGPDCARPSHRGPGRLLCPRRLRRAAVTVARAGHGP
jgi:hypothetical protein